MNKKTYGALAGLLLMAMSSCSDDAPWYGSDSEGEIHLELSSDGRVASQTRADDSVSPIEPSADEFSVSLKKSDNSYSKTWESVEAFNREGSFPVGQYTLAASYGDLNVEGFVNPYFYGQTSVDVSPSSLSEAKIVATLANSMVSIRYTDALKNNFTAYSAAVQSEGHEWVVFSQQEDRPAFIAPGNDVKLNLTLTDTEGRQVTIQPASFTAQPRHHYIVNIGVNGSAGNLVLDVQFEENVVNETVEVSLDDDLFTAEPPAVKAVGFEADSTIEGFEGLIELPQAEFQVFTFGGLSKANLNFETNSDYTPSFGKNIQLVNASDVDQSRLASEGIECIGFFKKPEKMGIVRVTDFLKKLPVGSHTIELQAVDAFTRVSTPVKLSVVIKKVQFEFEAVVKSVFGTTELVVDITTNCPDVKEQFTFRAPDSNNKMEEVKVTRIEQLETQGKLGTVFRYHLAVKPQTGSEADVEATYNGTTISTKVPVVLPEYSFATDAFARYVLIKLSSEDMDIQQLADNLKFFNNGTEISKNNISFDADNGIIKIVGLTPGASYNDMTAQLGRVSKPVPAFVTETEMALPNGDFAESETTINIPSINVGGIFKIGFGNSALTKSSSQAKSSIIRNTPTGNWATINDYTCYTGSLNQNTWYLVPSTWVENEQAVIRSVGYHHNGEEIPFSENGVTTKYYCTNVPKDLNKRAGELFLGSYSFTANGESRIDGTPWSSRPTSLSFDYSYNPENNEQAEVKVSVLGDGDEELANKTIYLNAQSSVTNYTVVLDSYLFGKKAKKMVLCFKSTKSGVEPSIVIPTGGDLAESELNSLNYISNPTISANNYHSLATGSVLTIDNVKFGYEATPNPANAKREISNKRR